MLESIKKLGPSGIVGVLVGIGLVIWIEPTTDAGIGIIIIVSVFVFLAAGAAIAALFRKNDEPRSKK